MVMPNRRLRKRVTFSLDFCGAVRWGGREGRECGQEGTECVERTRMPSAQRRLGLPHSLPYACLTLRRSFLGTMPHTHPTTTHHNSTSPPGQAR